jgi:uncharacterized protein
MTPFTLLIITIALGILPACAKPPVQVEERAPQIETLLLSAEQGTAMDKYNLGLEYEKGMLVARDYREAVRWYRLSAVQGHSDAQYKLCELSEGGQGSPQDYQEALRWCGLAADQGHGQAMFMIGRLYHTGHGVPQDLVQAHVWYNLATANGYNDAKKWRDRLAEEMSATQIAQAQKLARERNLRISLSR